LASHEQKTLYLEKVDMYRLPSQESKEKWVENHLPTLENTRLKTALSEAQQLFFGFAPATIIATAAKLNLFSLLTSPVSAENVAEERKLSTRGVLRILRSWPSLEY